MRIAQIACVEALELRGGNSHAAWASLAVRSAQIEARLRRLENPTARRHHPAKPVRPPRPTRFLRTFAVAD